MSKTPECKLCQGSLAVDAKGVLRCTVCMARDLTEGEQQEKVALREAEASVKVLKTRKNAPRETPFNITVDDGSPIFIGIDPGARYTGLVVRQNDAILLSSTIVRQEEMDPLAWAREVVRTLKPVLADFPDAIIGIETVTAPTGFSGGKKAPLNPKHIINAAAVAGAVANEWNEAYIILPKGNGSQHESHYPKELIGRRPKTLPGNADGAKTRNHERSAYDIAGKTQEYYYEDGKHL